jgi:type I restriction-modification system DNA methylase subunit
MDAYTPLYKRFKKYFGYLNKGHKGKNYDVYPYNGGLFRPDDILDKITIDDDLLYEHTLKLSEYDFDSEVDVNILGHIFENSLNEIEEIQTKLEENPSEVKISKRKKDGVFYTPKYITKYIVENTVGKLCEEKKTDLELTEEDYNIKRQAKTKKALLKKLNDYRDWLLQLTVVDPACGSGAFLNETLNYLIAEHKYLDELETKLMGGGLVFPNVENSILENNLFGVDINNESVEIAKLSLWLRTAQPNRKLNDLSNNIKCGNSLIDDPGVAGDKAFDWEKEFPQVFAKGGFDVVIGNPPYVAKTFTNEEKRFYNQSFETAQYQLDLYVTFMEVGTLILKKNGKISYIVPNSWLKNLMFSNCRLFLLNNLYFKVIVPNLDNVFSDASVDTLIFVALKSKKSNTEIDIGQFLNTDYNRKHIVDQNRFFDNERLIFDVEISKELESIFNKIDKGCMRLSQISEVTRGINPYDKYRGQSAEVIKNKVYHSNEKKDETFVPEIRGKHVNRYSLEWDGESYVSYGEWLAAPREPKFFEGKRIICRQVLGIKLNCTFIDTKFIIDQSVFISKFDQDQSYDNNPKFILAQLTSRLVSYYFRYKANEFDSLFPKIKIGEYKSLPVMLANKTKQKTFIEKADEMLDLNKELQDVSSKFQRSLQRQFPEELIKLSKKLQDWYELSYANFMKELKKKKIKLSLSQEAEWEEYFLAEQQKAKDLKSKIDKTDREIDQMVYELYGLTEDEIEIVENS